MPFVTGPIRAMLANMSPTWLSREWGEKLVIGLMGYMGDALLEAATLALTNPWLLERTSAYDAVEYSVAETRMVRYPADTDATHRARAASPWAAWTYAGTQDGIGGEGQGLDGQLHLFGFPNAFTKADYEYDFGDYPLPYGPDYWSRFWVFIPESDHTWTDDGAWDDPGTWDDGGAWDISATAEEIRSLRQLIRQWKAGHEICQWIVVMGTGELWDYPAGIWNDPGNWDDGTAPIFISPT